jgi:imidazolonepropionase-like amidohydrolase
MPGARNRRTRCRNSGTRPAAHARRLRTALTALLAACAAAPLHAQGPARVKALVGGMLIDGHGGPPLQNSVVLIEGERITAVGTTATLPVPAGAEVIPTHGMSVLPGLWDMHVHLMITGHSDYAHWDRTYPDRFASVIMPASAHQLLLAGVTSARDLGAPLEASIAVRDAINAGRIPGPTLYVSGPFIQKAPYPGTELFRWGVNGEADARAKVRRLAEAGVDVIKLIDQDQMRMAELRAVVEEAHRHGKPVIAHAHRPDEIRRGLDVGVDGFEHTGLATAPGYPDDILERLRERAAQGNRPPLFWTPTIEGLFNYEYTRDAFPGKLHDPCWRLGLPDDIIEDIARSLAHWDRLSYFRMTAARRPTLENKFRQLRSTGTVLLIGTDSGIPGKFHCQSTWNELDIWVDRLGVPPMEAIRAATYWPAVAMGVEHEVGTIAPGKYADIIAVRGDVLRYVSLLQDVKLVIKRGTRYR